MMTPLLRFGRHRCNLYTGAKYAVVSSLVLFLFTFCVLLFSTLSSFLSNTETQIVYAENKSQDGDPSVLLLVLLLSAPNNLAQRDAVRRTWLRWVEPSASRALFSIGTLGLDAELGHNLSAEGRLHGDLLLLDDVKDSYSSLSNKLIASLHRLPVNFTFLLKGDDDSFVLMPPLIDELRTKSTERLYWGFFDGRARVKKSGPWAEDRWVLCDRYLPHARGGGYVITADLARYIVRNAALLQHFASEDVAMGTWLAPLDITRTHDPRFDTEYVSRGCSNAYLVTHKQGVADMDEKWSNVERTGQLCGGEGRRGGERRAGEWRARLSYEYDWSVPPSLCCVRHNSSIP